MSIIQARDITKAFSGRPVLSGLSFSIGAADKIGLIGRNGSGKTTLLKLIAGQLQPDTGTVSRAYSTVVSVLGQRPPAQEEGMDLLDNPRFVGMERRMRSIRREMEGARGVELEDLVAEFSRLQQTLEDEGAFDYQARLAANLAGLGLSDAKMRQAFHTLSGGEQMRVALGRLLLEPADLILLDEPTNHLDYDGLDWLSVYLKSRQTAMVVVSHDRWFLDQVCDRIFEVENGRLTAYRGNFSGAMAQKQERLDRLNRTMDRLADEIERQETVSQTMRSHRKMKSYHSREKVVDKLKEEMNRLRDQVNPDRRMVFSFLGPDGKKDKNRLLIKAEALAMSYDRPLFRDLSLEVRASDRIALVGPNGCGKTTLLHMLLGRIEAEEGRLTLFGDPVVAFMGQRVDFRDETRTVYGYLAEAFPATETAIRSRLARFGFREEAMAKKLEALSGGERHRLYLCSLLEERPDLLVLDEPTNHLDIESRRLLEEALVDFHGAVIVVSHDRYFINTLARTVWGFVGDTLERFADYDGWYRRQQAAREAGPRKEEPKKRAAQASRLRKERADQREALARVARSIEALEEARHRFEQEDSTNQRPEDYEDYARILAELEALYQTYFELEEDGGPEPGP